MPETTLNGNGSGYAIVDDVIGGNEVRALLDTLGSTDLLRSRAGARHLMGHPAVREVARDVRLMTIARSFLGRDAVPYRATLFDKTPSRNWLVVWHQDTALPLERRRDKPGWGPWSVKARITYAHAPSRALSTVVALRLHFDDSAADNGPLRVIPGTHVLGVLSDAEIAEAVRRHEPVDCLVAAGGIVAMRPLILHASSKTTSTHPRRVLHIEYAVSLSVDEELRIAIA